MTRQNRIGKTKIELSVIEKSIKVTLKIQHSYIPMADMTINGFHIPFPEDSFSTFIQAWENHEIPKSLGQHTFNFEPAGLDFNKDLITFKSKIEYTVECRERFAA